MKKNVPIFRKKVNELIHELKLTPVEVLQVVEPVAEIMRQMSRKQVEDGVNEWKRKKGIARIKTDY